MTPVQEIQNILGVKADGIWGPITQGALDALLHGQASYHVVASTFADPEDVARFRRCKALGKSDSECFKIGDNGIGAWGDDTTTSEPQCALPPEVIMERWGTTNAGHNKMLHIVYRDHWSMVRLTDLMPHLANIHTSARIDLNPGAVEALGIPLGGMVAVNWSWA